MAAPFVIRPLVAVVCLCFPFAGCGSDDQAAPTRTGAAKAPEERLVTWRDEERGLTVSYPATWQRGTSSLTPHLSDPVEVLALGTYELRPGGDRCAHMPVNAVEDLGAEDALLVIFERAAPFTTEGYPPRQFPPELKPGTGRFCAPVTGRLDSWIAFGENGRAFYALLALGEGASEKTNADLLATFESITFDPR